MVENEEPFRRGMVIMAHPDDAEWGCAGTVAKWCADGWDVVYVLGMAASMKYLTLIVTSKRPPATGVVVNSLASMSANSD